MKMKGFLLFFALNAASYASAYQDAIIERPARYAIWQKDDNFTKRRKRLINYMADRDYYATKRARGKGCKNR